MEPVRKYAGGREREKQCEGRQVSSWPGNENESVPDIHYIFFFFFKLFIPNDSQNHPQSKADAKERELQRSLW